jgi:hypothetical protein
MTNALDHLIEEDECTCSIHAIYQRIYEINVWRMKHGALPIEERLQQLKQRAAYDSELTQLIQRFSEVAGS